MKKTGIALTMMTALFSAGPAFAGGAVTGGATLPEQIVQEGTQVEQLAKQAESVQEQIQEVVNQLQNLQSLGQGFNSSVFGQLEGDIQQLIQINEQANSLSYAGQNITGQLQQEYPGASASLSNLSTDYQTWNTTTNQDMQNLLQEQHLASNQFTSQDQAMQYIEQEAQSATGRMEVEQAAVAASNLTTKAIHTLAQTTMTAEDEQVALEKQKKAQDNASSQAVATGMFGGFTNGNFF